MPDYIPTNEAGLLTFFSTHAAGVAAHGPTLGLSAAEITQAQTDANTVDHALNGQAGYSALRQAFTQYKNILLYAPVNTPMPATPVALGIPVLLIGALPGCVTRARQRAERMKSHPNYTPAIGEDCAIEAPEPSPGPTQPTLNAKALMNYQVELTFAMYGNDMIEIECRRAGETEFTTLGFDTHAPYIDARPPLVAGQPEVREYRIRYVNDNIPTGEWSIVVQVTVKN